MSVLTPTSRKKMLEVGVYQPARAVERGSPSEGYVEMNRPAGYYHGEWQDQQMHGIGEFFFKDGSYYSGTFERGVAEGEGRYIFNNGCVYEGGISGSEASG